MIRGNDEILKEAMQEGLRELRMHFGGLDEWQLQKLNGIVDEAEREDNPYTVLFVLMALEDNIREVRERLQRCVYYKSQTDKNEKK